jgi:trypsin-like peptidase
MATIIPDPLSLTTHHLHLCFKQTDAVISSGTGFLYESEGAHYMVTNWHNVTGRNPLTGACLSETLAVPDVISTMFRLKDRPGYGRREEIPLYLDDQMRAPAWYEHPSHGSAVDVVVIPLPKAVTDAYQLFPLNAIPFDTQFKEVVADEAFVVGYPFSETTYLQLPIWKRASIASEPDVDLDQLPKLFIDTATRPGLSGSPVIMRRVGIHGMKGDKPTGSEMIGQIQSFLGIYSGRVGADELKAQLGIVWKARVLSEIINSRCLANEPGAGLTLSNPDSTPS